MKILHRYIAKDWLVIFGMTLLIFTFVMYIGAVIKAIDLMSRGVSGAVIFKIFTFNIPYILSFSIPISALAAVLLLFSRLSFDGEITAMKSCGLGMWQICAPVILLSVVLAFICVFINAVAAPNSHFARRELLMNVGMDDPTELLEEAQWNRDFPGIIIYLGKKTGSKVQDVVVYETDTTGVVKRSIRAAHGTISTDAEDETFIVDLYKVRIDNAPSDEDKDDEDFSYISADHYVEELDYGQLRKKGTLTKRSRDRTLSDLIAAIRDIRSVNPNEYDEKKLRKEKMSMMIEASERFALSFCCVAFTLVGIPLGMKSRRKESSVGIGISLAVVFVFYFFVILAESLAHKPGLRPDFIVWIPVFIAQIVGIRMLHRYN